MKTITLKWVSALVTVLTLASSCAKETPSGEPDIIGHRGLPTVYPENTAESFNGLLKGKIFRLETDVLMAAGDTVMIFHDAEVSRLTPFYGPLLQYTPTQIKAGIKARSGGTGLTFTEFLDGYVNRFQQVYFDLKDGQGDLVYRLVDNMIAEINKRDLHQKIVFTSTNEKVLEYIQEKDRKIQLATDYGTEGLKSAMRHHFRYCLIPIGEMSSSLYSIAQSGRVKLIAYTTTNIIECERAIVYGCDGIMTDVGLEMNELYGK
jgi:glycerophosphoryl diester phosphodiesterase